MKQRQKWFVIERIEHSGPKYKIAFSLYLYYVTPVSTPQVDLKIFSEFIKSTLGVIKLMFMQWYIFMQWQLPLTLFEIIIVGMMIVLVVCIQRCLIYTFVILYIKAERNYLLNLYLFAWIFINNLKSAAQQLHWVMPACTSPTLLSLIRELLTYLAYNIMC